MLAAALLHVTVDAHDNIAAGKLRWSRRPGQHHRLPYRVTKRWDPQILLELGQRLREGLGDGTRAVDGSARNTADVGRHRARLQHG